MTVTPSTRRADLALLGLAAIWGLTFPLIRTALSDVDAWRFLALRFTLAAAAFAPLVLPRRAARSRLRPAIGPAALLGFVAWLGYLTQTLGLRTVPSARAAFVTGTSVVLVPVLAPLFRAGLPGRRQWIGVALALGGLWAMTNPRVTGIGPGDLWVLACAVSYAVYIHLLQRALERGLDPLALAFLQVVAVAALSLAALPLAGPAAPLTPAVWKALLFTALAATVGSFWLQSRFQGRTTPTRAALMFSMEPVFATLFGIWLLEEVPSPREIGGAALILAAVLSVELEPLRRRAPRGT